MSNLTFKFLLFMSENKSVISHLVIINGKSSVANGAGFPMAKVSKRPTLTTSHVSRFLVVPDQHSELLMPPTKGVYPPSFKQLRVVMKRRVNLFSCHNQALNQDHNATIGYLNSPHLP